MRPASHRSPSISCGTCKHSVLVCNKLHLLCFHGDSYKIVGRCGYPVESFEVELSGENVSDLEGDAYDSVWAGRVVDPDEICDEWEGVEDG